MLNPVLTLDLRLALRRGRVPWMRYAFAGWLLLQAIGLAWVHARGGEVWHLSFADQVEWFTWFLAAQHFLFLLIAIPAHLAGAITDEKAKGTLLLLLTTDLSGWEIILGKFVGRLIQVCGLAAVGLPLFCFVGTYFGLATLATVLGVLLLSIGMLFVLGAASVFVSTCSDQARSAATRLYLAIGLGIAAWWALLLYGIPWLAPGAGTQLAAWLGQTEFALRCLNPLYVLDATWVSTEPAEFNARLKTSLLIDGSAGLAFLTLAIWRVRPEALRALERPRRRTQGVARAGVDDEPIEWRERVTGRPWVRRGLAIVIGIVATVLAWWLVQVGKPWAFAPVCGAAAIVASLFVAIRASGTITSERERQTWDSLLITPLETWELLFDKRSGVLQSFHLVLAAFAIPMVIGACWLGTPAIVLTLGACLVCFALAYFMASTGVWRSAEARGSWRSLVSTLAHGYGYLLGTLALLGALAGLGLTCFTLPLVGLVASELGITGFLEKHWYALVAIACVLVAWRLHTVANRRLWDARTWIDNHERYGRSFTRSLTRALRKHEERLAAKKRAEEEKRALATAAPSTPPA